jgi:adenylate kinase
MKIIFLGPPGAGKGTKAEIVAERLGIPTISTGAIIREAIKSGSPMGVEAKKFIDAGNLISDDVVIGIVKERLAKSDCKRGFILDGFPRTVSQAIALGDMGVVIDRVVFIDVPDEVIFDRMSGRRVCQKCGATYHVTDHPSKAGDLCEKCGGELMIRSDDAPEVVHSRLEVYHTTTEPLYDYYVAQGNLVKVDGLGSVEETIARTFRALGVE